MPMIYVTPAKGARVRMPERNSSVMAQGGAWVPRTVHYEHLLACGDVVLAAPPASDRDVAPTAQPGGNVLHNTVSPSQRPPAQRSAASKEK